MRDANVPAIKEYIASFKAPGIKGLNVNYKFADERVREAVTKAGLGLSVFTVDDLDALQKIVNSGYDNVTTNEPVKAYEFLGKQA